MAENAVQAALSQAQAIQTINLLRDGLEQLAYAWYRQAIELDPEWPWHDDTVADTIEQAGYIGHAEGLRQAATDLLKAINKGRPCAKCSDPIGDPDAAPNDDSALCRACGDPG